MMGMRIRIFDDLHGKEIYEDLKVMIPGGIYPIKKDVLDPLLYLEKIKDGDVILLDNYFDGWESPLGNDFLKLYLKKGLLCKIVSISDFGEKLVDMFEYWKLASNSGDVIGWVTTKKGKDIGAFLKDYFKIE